VISAGTYTAVAGSTVAIPASQAGNSGTYTVTTSNAYATATVSSENSSGAIITVTGVAAGSVNVVITGTNSVSATQAVTISSAPISISPNVSTLSLIINQSATATITEPGNAAGFLASSSNSAAVTATISGSTLTINGVAATNGSAAVVTISEPPPASGAAAATPVTIAVSVSTAPVPIPTPNTTQGSEEIMLQNLAPVGLYIGKAGSGFTLYDTSGDSANGTYGANITWGPGLTVAPSSANYAPVYPGPEATDSPSNYASTPVNTLLQPALATTLHAIIAPTSTAASTWIVDYGLSGNAPYAMAVNSSNEPYCVFRGLTSSGATAAMSVTSPSALVTGTKYDILCGTNGAYAYLTINGQLVTQTTPLVSPNTFAQLNYGFSTTRGLDIGSSTGAAATYAAPYSANFVGQISHVAIIPSFVAPPASASDNNSEACSLYNAGIGQPAGTACAAPSSTPITFTNSGGNAITNGVDFTSSIAAAQVVTANQSGNTTFALTNSTGTVPGLATATLSGSSITVTPVSSNTAGGTTVFTVTGGGTSAGLVVQITAGGGSNTVSVDQNGSPISSLGPLTVGGPAVTLTVVQAGYSGGFSIATPLPNSAVITASLSGATLTITPVGAGTTTLLINGNGTASLRFTATVPAKATSKGH
jgi:hypothetical protein